MSHQRRIEPPLRTVQGQPSWRLQASHVEAWLTRQGGHLAPVYFQLKDRRIQPFSIAPWAEEPLPAGTPPIIRALRGDFFCLPFGANLRPYRGEHHPLHGETANRAWRFVATNRTEDATIWSWRLATRVRRGRVDKRVMLRDGHTAVYCEHVIQGMSGPTSLGHHAMLKFPDTPGSGRLSFSPFLFGMTPPWPVEDPAQGGYFMLRPNTVFQRLDRVPTITGAVADLRQFPARRGFEDLALLVTRPAEPFAWVAVTFPSEGYVWFALKDPTVLRQTLLWISNGGRHYPPWNGRHINVMGIEDITGFFHYGLPHAACANVLTRRGVPTHLTLSPKSPLAVRYIMAVAAIPRAFDEVAQIRPGQRPHTVELQSRSKRKVIVPIQHTFLQTGACG